MIDALIGPVSNILDKFVEDKDKKAALAHEIATMAEKQAHSIALAGYSNSFFLTLACFFFNDR